MYNGIRCFGSGGSGGGRSSGTGQDPPLAPLSFARCFERCHSNDIQGNNTDGTIQKHSRLRRGINFKIRPDFFSI